MTIEPDAPHTTEVRTTYDPLSEATTEVRRTQVRSNGAAWWAGGLVAIALIAAIAYVATHGRSTAPANDAAVATAAEEGRAQGAQEASQADAALAQSAAQSQLQAAQLSQQAAAERAQAASARAEAAANRADAAASDGADANAPPAGGGPARDAPPP